MSPALALHRRLVARVGDEQAMELMEAPNSHLGGRTPQELIDRGELAPVESMIRDMESHAGVKGVSRPSPQSFPKPLPNPSSTQ